MARLLRPLLLVAVLLGLPATTTEGCATGYQAWHQDEGPAIYGGVRLAIASFGAGHTTIGDMIFTILDFPLSIALDTAFLPFAAINEAYEGGILVDPPPPPPKHSELRRY